MKTLQEHYNAIKNGQGNKTHFLKQARLLFPEYINQYSDFDSATRVLRSKQIISEAAGGVVSKGFNIWDWKKILAEEVKAEEKKTSKEVEDYRKNAYDNTDMKNADNINFNEIMKGFYAELKDEKNNGKTGDEIKAIVVKNLAKDPLYYTKNGEFGVKGIGYTTEAPGLGTPKEAKGKHKSSGYGDLDTDKKIEKVKANVQDSLGDKEAKTSMPSKVKEMEVTPKSASGVKRMPMPGAEKKMKLQEVFYGDSDGDRDADMEATVQANEYYDKGLEAYTAGDTVKAEKYYQAALKAGAWLGWTEADLPPYNTLKENTDILDQHLSAIESNNMKKDEAYAYLEDQGLTSSQINLIMNYAFPIAADKDIPFLGMTEADKSAVASDSEADKKRKKGELAQLLKYAKESGSDPDTIKHLEDKIAKLTESKLRSIIRQVIKEEIEEAMYQGPSVKLGTGGSLGGRRFIPNATVLSRDAIEAINAKGAKRLNWGKPHVKIVKSGDGVKLLISKLLVDTIVGSERGRSKLSLSVSKMGTGITPEEMSELTGEFKKLVKVLNAGGKLTQNGDYYLLDVPTKYNEDKNQYEMPLPNQLEEELNEGSIEINGKTVKTYTQNGDTSYNVTYDDGTKDIIYVNNDGWDEINQLHRNAIGDDAYRKQFSKK